MQRRGEEKLSVSELRSQRTRKAHEFRHPATDGSLWRCALSGFVSTPTISSVQPSQAPPIVPCPSYLAERTRQRQPYFPARGNSLALKTPRFSSQDLDMPHSFFNAGVNTVRASAPLRSHYEAAGPAPRGPSESPKHPARPSSQAVLRAVEHLARLRQRGDGKAHTRSGRC